MSSVPHPKDLPNKYGCGMCSLDYSRFILLCYLVHDDNPNMMNKAVITDLRLFKDVNVQHQYIVATVRHHNDTTNRFLRIKRMGVRNDPSPKQKAEYLEDSLSETPPPTPQTTVPPREAAPFNNSLNRLKLDENQYHGDDNIRIISKLPYGGNQRMLWHIQYPVGDPEHTLYLYELVTFAKVLSETSVKYFFFSENCYSYSQTIFRFFALLKKIEERAIRKTCRLPGKLLFDDAWKLEAQNYDAYIAQFKIEIEDFRKQVADRHQATDVDERIKNEAIRIKNEAIRIKDEVSRITDEAIRIKDEIIAKDGIMAKDEVIAKVAAVRAAQEEVERLIGLLQALQQPESAARKVS